MQSTSPTPPSSTPSTQANQVNIAPPDVNTLETPSKQAPIKLILIGVVAIVLVIGGVAGFLVLPKVFTQQFVGQLKPEIASLKSSAQNVRSSIDKIHYSVTSQMDQTQPEGLKTSGLLIHPQISSLLVGSNILGVLAKKMGPIEKAVDSMRLEASGSVRLSGKLNPNVAGTTTSETPIIERFREVHDETQVANQDITKAQNDLSALTAQITKHPPLLTSQAQQKIIGDTNLSTNMKTYLDETGKVTSYYQTLSETLVTMDTKIASFKTALTSATTAFAQLSQAANDLSKYQTILNQTQTYLNQAKSDATELKKLATTLQSIPKDQLPQSSDNYHHHNVQVLNAVTTYFDTQSSVLQNIVDATQALSNKMKTNTLTTADLTNYREITANGSNKATESDTQFASDMQSLVGEENSLTLSFWQNNAILSKGASVTDDITAFQNNLNTL